MCCTRNNTFKNDEGACLADPGKRVQPRRARIDRRRSAKSKITKGKGFKKVLCLNEVTGRMNQELQCSMCSKKFYKLCNVKDHIRTHLGSRPFNCDLCGKIFTQRGNRDRHQKKAVCKNRAKQASSEESM